MTLDEMLALLPDNTTGQISPADLRAIVTDLYTGPVYNNYPGPWISLPAAASYTSLPTPLTLTIPLAIDRPLLVTLTAYIDTAVNNNEVALSFAYTGATVSPAGSEIWRNMRLGAKVATQSSQCHTWVQLLNAGETVAELKYTAEQAGASIQDVNMVMVRLA
jgi:hypothetical protein